MFCSLAKSCTVKLFHIHRIQTIYSYHVFNCNAIMADPLIQTFAVPQNTVGESTTLNLSGKRPNIPHVVPYRTVMFVCVKSIN